MSAEHDAGDAGGHLEPRRVAELLAATAGRRGWGSRLEGAQVHHRWAEIAGTPLDAHAEPIRLHGGVLVVRVDSAAWATQMRYLSGQLAERVNAVLGEQTVRRVTVVVGPLADSRQADGPSTR
ncbi:MAG: DUF721 domain-containing protein [Actinomycetota bacterium]|nr:DUF721 domain-containing protein [Actinomycetota bacterium]